MIPFLYFYITSFIVAVTRIISSIYSPEGGDFILIDSFTASFAKICEGVAQSWMALEIALRLRQQNKIKNSNDLVRDTVAGRKLEVMLKYGQIIMVVSCTLYFIGFFAFLFSENFLGDRYQTAVPKTLAWSSFVVFCFMAVTNIILFA